MKAFLGYLGICFSLGALLAVWVSVILIRLGYAGQIVGDEFWLEFFAFPTFLVLGIIGLREYLKLCLQST